MPSKAPGPGSFPIPDANHARAAKSMEGNASPANRKKINAKANAKLTSSKKKGK